MSKTIKPLADNEIESPADSVMRRKINEIVKQTNENTRRLESNDRPRVRIPLPEVH